MHCTFRCSRRCNYRISTIHKYLPEDYKPEHTIFVITTDGLENASVHYTYQQVKHLITEKEEAGWDFLFLGANIDAAAEATKIGIPVARAATFIADTEGSKLCLVQFALKLST